MELIKLLEPKEPGARAVAVAMACQRIGSLLQRTQADAVWTATRGEQNAEARYRGPAGRAVRAVPRRAIAST